MYISVCIAGALVFGTNNGVQGMTNIPLLRSWFLLQLISTML